VIHVLLTGTLYDTPTRRIARNGHPFATTKLLADVGNGSMVWCSMIAFAEAGERLAMLQGVSSRNGKNRTLSRCLALESA